MMVLFFNPGIIIGVLLLLCIVTWDVVCGWIVPVISFFCDQYIIVMIITLLISLITLRQVTKDHSKSFVIMAGIMWVIVDLAMVTGAIYFLDLFVFAQEETGFLTAIFGGIAMIIYMLFDLGGGMFVKVLGSLPMEEPGGTTIGLYILSIIYLGIGYVYFGAMAGSLKPFEVLDALLLFTQ